MNGENRILNPFEVPNTLGADPMVADLLHGSETSSSLSLFIAELFNPPLLGVFQNLKRIFTPPADEQTFAPNEHGSRSRTVTLMPRVHFWGLGTRHRCRHSSSNYPLVIPSQMAKFQR